MTNLHRKSQYEKCLLHLTAKSIEDLKITTETMFIKRRFSTTISKETTAEDQLLEKVTQQ